MTEEAIYVMEKMAHGLQRGGRHDGGGFYDYDDDADGEDGRELWSGLSAFGRRGSAQAQADAADRLRLAPVIEALHSLCAGALLDESADTDSARLLALAQAAARCSGIWQSTHSDPLAWPSGPAALQHFEQRTAELAGRYGKRFQLPPDWRTLLGG